ncbi:hypothetical protein [Gimesia sp.]|uniref:hypothetical protein n=1 Tax=Gimesia sp. TaxID=2024833 RepID=UPI000C3A0340|nr:hypothetical protein [Gimesia sp.]MAX37524.1 hypothetical protein [Gimesia sp.]
MKYIDRICSLSVILMMNCVVFAAVSDADEPDIAELKRAIPVLSPENEDLNSFYFVAESVIPYGVPTAFEACWSRASGFGYVLVDQLGYPMLFVAEKQMLLCDALQSQVILWKDVSPNVLIQSKNRYLTVNLGFKSKQKENFLVDVPSFVSTAKTEPDLSRVNETDWKLTYNFDKNAQVVYLFRVDREIAFKSVLLMSQQQPLITIRNVVINQPVPERLMKFPDKNVLAAAVTVEESPEKPPAELGEALGEVFDKTLSATRALAIPAAIQDTRLRRLPFTSDTDWEEVEKNHKRIGGKLRDFLRVDIKDRVVLPLQ